MRLRDFTLADAKKLGYARLIDMIDVIKREIPNYPVMTKAAVEQAIRAFIAQRNDAIEQAANKRLLTNEMLFQMRRNPETVERDLDKAVNANAAFRPCYVQIRIEAITALIWCIYSGLDVDFVTKYFDQISKTIADYVRNGMLTVDELQDKLVKIVTDNGGRFGKYTEYVEDLIDISTGRILTHETAGDRYVMRETKYEAVYSDSPLYYEDPSKNGIAKKLKEYRALKKQAEKDKLVRKQQIVNQQWAFVGTEYEDPGPPIDAQPTNDTDVVNIGDYEPLQPPVQPLPPYNMQYAGENIYYPRFDTRNGTYPADADYKYGDILNIILPPSSRSGGLVLQDGSDKRDWSAGSDIMMHLSELHVVNTIVNTQQELSHYISRMNDAVIEALKICWFDINGTGTPADRAEIARYKTMLKQVDITQKYYITTDDQLRLSYVIRGRLTDFGTHIIDNATYDPPPAMLPTLGKPATCVITCIFEQCRKYLGLARGRILERFNDMDVTIDNIENIARACELHIVIYDLELSKWCDIDYSGNKRRTHTNRCVIAVRNNHAYCIKREYRDSLGDFKNKSLRGKTHLTPISHVDEDTHYGTFRLCMEPHAHLLFDECFCADCERGTNIHPRSRTIADVPSGVYFWNDNIGEEILSLLICNGVIPGIVANRNKIHALNFEITDTLPDKSVQKRNISLRSQKTRHQYLMFTPSRYNYTLNSISMYLFRTFIKQPMLMIGDTVITRIFKSRCKPMVDVEKCDVTGHCYIIDMVKAYRSCSSQIGLFTEYPTVTKMQPEDDIQWCGIYYCGDKWLFHDEIFYLRSIGEEIHPTLAIVFNELSDIMSDYGKAIVDDGLAVKDIAPADQKILFNALVGSFNPCIAERPITMVLKSDGDTDRFLMNPGHIIHSITDMPNGDKLVRYNYSENGVVSNLAYISAQIIARCSLRIRQASDKLKAQYGATIIGTMTDSLIFMSPTPVDFASVGIDIGKDLGQWTVREGTRITAVGPGQYTLYTDDQRSDVLRIRGYAREMQSAKLLQELFTRTPEKRGKDVVKPVDDTIREEQTHFLWIGEAGVGKSRFIATKYRSNDYLIMGPTGMSAASIAGRTIYGVFGLGHDGTMSVADSIIQLREKARTRIATAKYLVIDECYMVDLDTMVKVNEICKIVMSDYRDFGGKILILVGDDRQLPSVSEPFMNSEWYKRLKIEREEIEYVEDGSCRLTPNWRHFCNSLRTDRKPMELKRIIKDAQTMCAKTAFANSTSVYYANRDVDGRNSEMLRRMPGHPVAVGDGVFKQGCPVMLTRNGTGKGGSIREGVYNGNTGRFVSYVDGTLRLQIARKRDGKVVMDDLAVKGYTHIKLAFAITIHKIQGQTLDSINIYIRREHLRSADATRLLYVALTRVASADKCYIEII